MSRQFLKCIFVPSKSTSKEGIWKNVFSSQQLEEKTGSGDELWATVKASYQGLLKSLHRGTAWALSGRMDRERRRSVGPVTGHV